MVIATEIESLVEGLFKEEDLFEHVIIIYHAQTDKTKNRLMVAFDSNKGPNLKVVKWS